MKRVISAAIAVLPALAVPALANTTTVNCPGYIVALQDSVAIQAQVMIGSQSAFEAIVCERSSAMASNVDQVATIPVFIEELNVASRVVIFSTDSD